MPDTFVQVQTTVATRSDAERISRLLVEPRLAACVQIVGPVTSTYWWKGAVETSEEWFCIAKTRLDLYPLLEVAIKSAHPYEVPEIIATPIIAGSADYLRWIEESTKE